MHVKRETLRSRDDHLPAKQERRDRGHAPRSTGRSRAHLSRPDEAAREERAAAVMRVLAAWARSLEAGSHETARRYGREVKWFLEFIEHARGLFPDGLLAATAADCNAFVYLAEGISRSSRAVKAAVLRSMFGALVIEGLINTNPAADVKVRNAASGHHHRAVPVEEIRRVLAELAARDDIKSVRDRAIILTFLALGARRSEVARLKVGDIERTEDGRAHVTIRGKGDKVARMLLREGALRAIDRWLEVAGIGNDPDAPVFMNLSRRPDHRERGAITPEGVWHVMRGYFPEYCPHGLRARAIPAVWLNSDANLHMAQLFARHSSPTVTEQVYVQAEKLEKAMEFSPDYS